MRPADGTVCSGWPRTLKPPFVQIGTTREEKLAAPDAGVLSPDFANYQISALRAMEENGDLRSKAYTLSMVLARSFCRQPAFSDEGLQRVAEVLRDLCDLDLCIQRMWNCGGITLPAWVTITVVKDELIATITLMSNNKYFMENAPQWGASLAPVETMLRDHGYV